MELNLEVRYNDISINMIILTTFINKSCTNN
jgi:hypothetical protein